MVRPRLREVADLADVSEPTVSRVLNGRTGVAEPTRQRVIDALATLGYTDLPGRSTTRRGVIGLICGDFLNPVFPTFVHHISAELGRLGHMTTMVIADRLNPEERCIEELVANDVDGIVFIGGRHAQIEESLDTYRRLAKDDMPMVFVNGIATDIDVPHIRCDEEAGARKAVAHLQRLGHSRIGCVLGSLRFIPTRRFIDGFRQTMTEAGLDAPDDAVVTTAFTLEGGKAGATRLMDRGITGIITGNDLMALGAVAAATARGQRVPDQLSVVGYDGTDLTGLASPPLTTLRQPFVDMARLIADALRAEIDGSPRFRDQYVFEPELLSRDSTGPVAR